MSRKRLGGIDPSRARDARSSAEESARSKRASALGSGPPIAQVAASVSETIGSEITELKQANRALSEKGRELDAAKEAGRLVVELDLSDIDPMAISRDRRQLQKDGEEWAALKASISARGQQVPIEVTRRDGGEEPLYELVSGFRRWSALAELYQETRDVRFSKILAFVRDMPDTIPKMIAMVEENEIRHDISFFERGRVCALAVADGHFASVDEAVNVLFASSNRNRRYKIRCFVTVYEELGSLLDYPEELGERLGIALAKALREGRGAALVAALENRDTRFANAGQEMALLNAFVSGKGAFSVADETAVQMPSSDPVIASWTGSNNARIDAKVIGAKVTVTLKNADPVSASELEELVQLLAQKRQ